MPNLIELCRKILVTTWPSSFVALAAWISVIVAIDPGGSYPSMPQGPGLTVDEMFNVEQGYYLVEQARALGWYNLIPGTSVEAFRPQNGYNPDHPPFGRCWLGVHHLLTWWIAPPDQPAGPIVTACARPGSATAFAITVWLIGAYVTFTSLQTGGASPRWSGCAASLALVLMPRVYGHAHLAALETVTNLTCTAAVLAVAAWWTGPAAPSRRAALAAGFLLGLALLTKIQGILIPLPILAWAMWKWRCRSIGAVLLWSIVAAAVFFAGWPYLWLDPLGHLQEYLGRTTQRATLNCYYFGTRYADTAVPWHYPLVMFAVSVPVGLHVLGVLGVAAGRQNQTSESGQGSAGGSLPSPGTGLRLLTGSFTWGDRLILACGMFPLLVFALPGVAVYDGERLFLPVFPLWAIFVGRGAVYVLQAAARRWGAFAARSGLAILVLGQVASQLLVHPCYLSYYNLSVGGLRGAEALGLEMNYWGDALTRSLLQEAVAAQGRFSTVEIRPLLHQFQEDDLLRQSPVLRRGWVPLPRSGADGKTAGAGPLRLVFRRRADLSDDEFRSFRSPAGRYRPLATFRDSPDPQ